LRDVTVSAAAHPPIAQFAARTSFQRRLGSIEMASSAKCPTRFRAVSDVEASAGQLGVERRRNPRFARAFAG
jgi:hypothetical protein